MNSNQPTPRKIPVKTCLRRVAIFGLLLVAATTQAEQFGDFTYGVVGSNIQIYVYTGLGGDVVIPGEIDGMPVTTIDRDAFANVTGMTSITIPTNVTAIYDHAFSGCTGLRTVNLSGNLEVLRDGVFTQCTSLTNITVSPDNPILSSSNGILYDKTGTALIQFPCGVGDSVSLPEGVMHIGNSAFAGDTALTNIIFPESLGAIGSSSFALCSGLVSVFIPAGVSNISAGAFAKCETLTAFEVSESNSCYSAENGILLDYLGTTLVQYPGGLTGIYDIPAGITNITRSAFSGCAGLTGVIISTNVATIGSYAFSGCTGLTTVTVPHSVAAIEGGTFNDCTGLTNIFLSDGIADIGSGAFSRCSALGSIHIPNSVTRLGWGAFQYCFALTNILLGAGIATIESRAFYECNDLRDLHIPESVTNLWDGVFDYCHGLTNIAVADGNPVYSSMGGVVFSMDHISLLHFPGGFEGRYVVPDGVQVIGDYAFDQSLSLTCVELPASCAYLGRYAFSHCTNLTGICFNGAPPGLGIQTFLFASNVVMYYRSEHAAEWGATFADRPTALWPEFSSAEIQPTGFAFDVIASDGQEIVVEMCPDLSTEAWTSVSTQTVSGGSLELSIPDWAIDPLRFYRATVRDPVP